MTVKEAIGILDGTSYAMISGKTVEEITALIDEAIEMACEIMKQHIEDDER